MTARDNPARKAAREGKTVNDKANPSKRRTTRGAAPAAWNKKAAGGEMNPATRKERREVRIVEATTHPADRRPLSSDTTLYDAMVIGGGAAGLMAAVALSRAGVRTILLEKQDRVGRKLLSTGNGRCNLTHLGARAEDYHGAREAARTALAAWPPTRITDAFAALGVPCVADEASRVYPMSRQAASVLDALRLACDEAGVVTHTGFAVTRLETRDGGFEARSAEGESVRARCALVCTGGLAAPKLGASGEGYRMLERFGHAITPRFAAITALRTPPEAVRGLKGLRAEGKIALWADGECVREERGELLFADYGVSGIAAMQLGRAANEALRAGKDCAAHIDLLPDADAAAMLRARAETLPMRGMEDFLNGIVPKRLGQALARAAGIDMKLNAAALTPAMIARLAATLTDWTLSIIGVQDFDQAQVTAGGASLADFDARTMQSLRAPGLFAAGEILDVDGDCGGFNLQWAWSSARMAAAGIEAFLKGE